MIRRMIVGAVTATVLLGVSAGIAGASSLTVAQAIKAQDKSVNASPAYKQLKNFQINTVAEAKKAIPEFNTLKGLFDKAATAVSHASATTSSQKTGQKDWVTGARKVATGIGELSTALTDIVDGDKSAAKSEAKKADAVIKAGDVLGGKGDRLLGLPTSD